MWNDIFGKLLDLVSKRRTLYVKLSKNNVEIKHIESGKTIIRSSPQSFSNDRLIIADFQLAEGFMRGVVNELLNRKNRPYRRSLDAVVQIIDPEIKIITPVERRTYHDSIEHVGAIRSWVCDHQKPLTDSDVMAFKK